jgi:hypothetical protein
MENFGLFCGQLEYFTAIWYILRPFGIFYGQLEYFTAIWYILWPFGNVVMIWYSFPGFGNLRHEKSGILVSEDQ